MFGITARCKEGRVWYCDYSTWTDDPKGYPGILTFVRLTDAEPVAAELRARIAAQKSKLISNIRVTVIPEDEYPTDEP